MDKNPYRPPEANLGLAENVPRESIWWKAFFVLSILLMLISITVIALVESITGSVFDYVDTGLSLVAMAGLFGFAFSRVIGKPVFWRYYFYAIFFETIFYSLILPIMGESRFGEVSQFDALYAFEIAYSVILLRALYLYAYRRNSLWKNT